MAMRTAIRMKITCDCGWEYELTGLVPLPRRYEPTYLSRSDAVAGMRDIMWLARKRHNAVVHDIPTGNYEETEFEMDENDYQPPMNWVMAERRNR